MNSASWLLYLSEVSESISTACAITLIFGGIFCALHGLFCVIEQTRYKAPKPVFAILAVAAFLGTFLPSQKTVLLIAASQEGQHLAQTPAAQQLEAKILQALNTQLDKLGK